MLPLPFPGLFGSRRFSTQQQRLNRLKLSTALTGLAALGCTLVAARLCLRAGVDAYTLSMHQHTLWLAHVPGSASLREGYAAVLLAALLCAAVLSVALSLHWLAHIRGRTLAAAIVLAIGASIVFNPYANRWMLSVPSAAERTIMWSEPAAAKAMLVGAGLHPVTAHYARAQLALRSGDQAALRIHGTEVLRLVDQWAYRVPRESVDYGSLEVIASLRPELVHAIDVAINRQALTHVGITWEQEHRVRSSQGGAPSLTWKVLYGVGAAALAAALALLWNGMRRRVGAISIQLSGTVSRADAPAARARGRA